MGRTPAPLVGLVTEVLPQKGEITKYLPVVQPAPWPHKTLMEEVGFPSRPPSKLVAVHTQYFPSCPVREVQVKFGQL